MWRNDTLLNDLLARGDRVIADAKSRWSGLQRQVRWSSVGLDDGKLDRLKEIVSSGHRLQALTQSPGWTDVLKAKAHYSESAERMCRNPSVTHEQRFKAACELAALDGLFVEIAARIRSGKDAADKIAELTR